MKILKLTSLVTITTLVFIGGLITGYQIPKTQALDASPQAMTHQEVEPPLVQNKAKGLEDTLLYLQVIKDLNDFMVEVTSTSVYTLDEDHLLNALKKGVLTSLNDPYSEWLSQSEYKDLMASINNEYSGFGFDLETRDQEFVIANVLSSSSADEAGLQTGDRLIGLNGVPLHGSDALFEGAKALQATTHTFDIIRNQKQMSLVLEPHPYQELAVSHGSLTSDIYYIDINTFSEETLVLFTTALHAAQAANATTIIYDVRYNLGGFMDICYDLLSLVNDEATIAYLHDKHGVNGVKRTQDQVLDTQSFVLVNNMSMSTAELFAHGMQTHDQAKLIGEVTYGKGIMQKVSQNAEGYLKLSTHHFSAQKDTTFTGQGLMPDILFYDPLTSKQGLINFTLDYLSKHP